MPVKKVKNGYKWGSQGKVYPTKKQAEAQAKAAYASGYKEKKMQPRNPLTGAPVKSKKAALAKARQKALNTAGGAKPAPKMYNKGGYVNCGASTKPNRKARK